MPRTEGGIFCSSNPGRVAVGVTTGRGIFDGGGVCNTAEDACDNLLFFGGGLAQEVDGVSAEASSETLDIAKVQEIISCVLLLRLGWASSAFVSSSLVSPFRGELEAIWLAMMHLQPRDQRKN
jgi:hypothetical protein